MSQHDHQEILFLKDQVAYLEKQLAFLILLLQQAGILTEREEDDTERDA